MAGGRCCGRSLTEPLCRSKVSWASGRPLVEIFGGLGDPRRTADKRRETCENCKVVRGDIRTGYAKTHFPHCGIDNAVRVGYQRGIPPRDVLLMSIPSPPRLLKYGSTLFPALLAVMGLLLLVRWVRSGPAVSIARRVPGLDRAPAIAPASAAVRPVPGEPIPGPGQPSAITAAWPWFRGPVARCVSPARNSQGRQAKPRRRLRGLPACRVPTSGRR